MIGENEEDEPFEDARDANVELTIPNAADPQALVRAKQIAAFTSAQRADFWKRALADPIGRTVLWEVLASMHAFEARFGTTPAGFPSPEATWFYAGEQAAGWRLYDALRKADFAGVHVMHLEHDSYFEQVKRTRKR